MTNVSGRFDKGIPIVVICGATATGKTGLALEAAERFGGEIISADSRQVYRHMNIGTAKATAQELARVPHHLVDVVDPDQDFTTADFTRLGREAIESIHSRGRLPMVVGGTGLYIRTLTEGLVSAPPADETVRSELLAREQREGEGTLHRLLEEVDAETAGRLPPRDLVRIVRALEVHILTGRPLSELQKDHGFSDCPYRLLKLGLPLEREELYARIDRRVEEMVQAGLLEEVAGLLATYSPDLKAMRTIGYREIIRHLQGEISLEEAVVLIQRASRRYAKRQVTWFGRDKSIIWVDSSRESAKLYPLIDQFNAK